MDNEISKMIIDKKKNGIVINILLVLLLLSGIGSIVATLFFNADSLSFFNDLLIQVSLFIFIIIFIYIIISNFCKKKVFVILGCFVLLIINSINILNNIGLFSIPSFNKVENFTNKSLVDVVSWASENNVDLDQDYEFSDMIDEYYIINQDVKAGTNISDISDLGISISQGPNPDKEIIIPSMIDWDSQRVIQFVEDNYLGNVEVEFITSDKAVDTVIEQNTSGNMKRSDLLKLTFSVGEEFEEEIKLIDFTNKSKFETEFFLKRYNLKYKFEEDFFKDIDKGLVGSQSVEPSTMVSTDSEEIIITISKGEEISLPDFSKMSIEEITTYVISNKLKIEFIYRYDDSVKKNEIIESNYEVDSKVEEGTIIKITISKGSLEFGEFDNLDSFYEWANEYDIKYETKNEFNNDVEVGKVIKYSHNSGDVIKNDDVITVYISDGKELEVPNVVGLSKSSATSKIEDIGLSYNYVYKYSNSVDKDDVISQSISSGSKVSSGTTVTLTISKGEEPETTGSTNNSESSSSNSSSSSSGSSSSGNSNTTTTPPTPEVPSCDKSVTTLVWAAAGNTGSATKSLLQSYYPNVNWSFNIVSSCSNGSSSSGTICNASSIDGFNLNHCDTYSVTIVE